MKKINLFKEKIEYYEKAYFPSEKKIDGIPINNNIEREFEDKEIVAKRLEKGKIDEIVVPSNNNSLKYVFAEVDHDNYLSEYGHPINKKKLHDYLSKMSKIWDDYNLIEQSNFKNIYELFVKDIKDIPDFIGCVHIINLIYFLSRKKWPIYDRFVHKSLKAFLLDREPYDIYVGTSPDKKDINNVVNMYSEYLWLIDKFFGMTNINRETDRALWVYGHKKLIIFKNT